MRNDGCKIAPERERALAVLRLGFMMATTSLKGCGIIFPDGSKASIQHGPVLTKKNYDTIKSQMKKYKITNKEFKIKETA